MVKDIDFGICLGLTFIFVIYELNIWLSCLILSEVGEIIGFILRGDDFII